MNIRELQKLQMLNVLWHWAQIVKIVILISILFIFLTLKIIGYLWHLKKVFVLHRVSNTHSYIFVITFGNYFYLKVTKHFEHVNDCLHYGKNCSKLVGFKEHKYIK